MFNVESIDAFPTRIFIIKEPKFLPNVKKVADQFISKQQKIRPKNKTYPITQTENIQNDPLIEDFRDFITGASVACMENQGFDPSAFDFVFNDMFVQEHRQGSGHERHFHAGCVITGFYFLRVPQNPPNAVFYDPRPAKDMGSFFFEKNGTDLTPATSLIKFTPQEGLFLFTNSWLHHSFERNESKEPFTLVHFDLFPTPKSPPEAVVV